MELGVCYYPEHWPEAWWADDARRMVEMGISHVRIGEFAWSRIEPEPGRFAWGWLDRAVETLAAQIRRLEARRADGTVVYSVEKPYKPTGGLRVLGGTHSWPGGASLPDNPSSMAIDATARILHFFASV